MPFDAILVDGDITDLRPGANPDILTVNGDELIVQKIEVRLRTWLGEWLLDRSQGMQYETLFMQKPPQVESFVTLVRREIEGVTGVSSVTQISGTFDAAEEKVLVEGRVQIEDIERAIEVRLAPDSFGFEFIGL